MSFDHTLHPIPRKVCNWSNQSKWSQFNWGNRGAVHSRGYYQGSFSCGQSKVWPTLFLRILPHLPMTLMRTDVTKILPRFLYRIFCARSLNKPYQTWPKATSLISQQRTCLCRESIYYWEVVPKAWQPIGWQFKLYQTIMDSNFNGYRMYTFIMLINNGDYKKKKKKINGDYCHYHGLIVINFSSTGKDVSNELNFSSYPNRFSGLN